MTKTQIIKDPNTGKKKEIEEGKSDRIVMKPTPVVAADQQSAAIAAVLDTESLGPVDRNRMEVLVRPFV